MGGLRCLLDAHALVFGLVEPERLGVSARQAMTDPGSQLLVSAATVWEMGIKARLGKWPAAAAVLDGLSGHLGAARMDSLPVGVDDALAAGRLDWDHRDPFDRMLVAQAMSRGLTIITRDRAIIQHPVPTLW